MIKVSMLEFLRTGEYGPIKLGMNRDQVSGILGEPENWGVPSRKVKSRENAGFWRYGNIEFHFIEDKLWLIFSDTFEVPEGGESVDLDPWLLKVGLTPEAVIKALAEEHIDFVEAVVPYREGTDVLTKSGCLLSFARPENSYGLLAGLYAIDRSAHPDPRAMPLGYRLIGQIEHFYNRIGVVRVQLLPEATLRQGQRVSFRMPERAEVELDPNDGFSFMWNFREQIVGELHADEQPVEQAAGGQLVTFKTGLSKIEAHSGVKVYLVND